MTAMTAVATAAVMTASTAVTTVAAMTAVASMTAAMASMTAMADKFNHRRSVSRLFVEDVERRQADIGDFLLTEREVIRIIPWNIGNRTRR